MLCLRDYKNAQFRDNFFTRHFALLLISVFKRITNIDFVTKKKKKTKYPHNIIVYLRRIISNLYSEIETIVSIIVYFNLYYCAEREREIAFGLPAAGIKRWCLYTASSWTIDTAAASGLEWILYIHDELDYPANTSPDNDDGRVHPTGDNVVQTTIVGRPYSNRSPGRGGAAMDSKQFAKSSMRGLRFD